MVIPIPTNLFDVGSNVPVTGFFKSNVDLVKKWIVQL